MARQRIEFDSEDGTPYSEALHQLKNYGQLVADSPALAAAIAARIAEQAQLLADHALVAAAESTSERALAEELGVPRPTLQYRIKRARNRVNGNDEEDEDQ